MNTTTENDINEEYERLFGMPKQINLFDTDEEYESFRQYILEQPQLIVDNSVLPFNDIHLKPFVEINRERVIEAEKKKEHHIFFIKQSKEGSKDYCFAAGYFDLESLQFIILRYSCVAPSNFFAPEDYALQVTRRKRLMNVSKSAFSCRYLTENVAYNNPSEAASHVLGHKADLRQWVNDHGHSLLTCYPSLEDYVPEYMELKRKRLLGEVIGLLQSPIKGVIQAVTGNVMSYLHVFRFDDFDRRWNAKGYYDPDTHYFYIMEGSLVAVYGNAHYNGSELAKARKRFLKKACVREGNYYRVIINAKCRSAEAATFYVSGETDNYFWWTDNQGKVLPEVYEYGVFHTQEGNLFPDETISSARIFYIHKGKVTGRICDASGIYEEQKNKFLLRRDSLLTLDTVASYAATTHNAKRLEFLDKYCKRERDGYRLKRDVLVDSPSQAASFVLGRLANGWTEWLDDNGIQLENFRRD